MYLLGQYEYLVGALHDLLGGLLTGSDPSVVIASGVTVGVFLVGFGIGIFTIAHIVRWALNRDRATTMTVLVGLMIGSLRFPAATINDAVHSWTVPVLIVIALAIGVGVFLVLLLDHYTDDLDYSTMSI
jgi:putative membrane protein